MKESELIRRCQRGEKEAFEALIRSFYPYVTKYLFRLTRDEALTEDLTQDVFLRMIRTIDRYQPEGRASFATYLMTIAKNRWIDFVRRSSPLITSLSEVDLPGNDQAERQALTHIAYEEVMASVDALPPEQAQAIRLKYIDEYTLQEIEAITGVPAKTVKSRIHEGTKKLRRRLGERKE